MLTRFRAGLLILLVALLAACGGGGGSSTSVREADGANDTPREVDTDPGEEPSTPPVLASDLTTNIFFPVFDSAALYYNDDTQASVLGETVVSGDIAVYPLVHPDARIEYLTSTPGTVGLKGINLRVIDGMTPVYLDLDFNASRAILGDSTPLQSTGNATVKITGIAGSYAVPVTLTATRIASADVEVGEWGGQPSRQIRLNMRLSLTYLERIALLAIYPFLEPLLDAIVLDLWFVPGVGIAKIQQGGWVSGLTRIEGVPRPHVFSFFRNASVGGVDPQQMQLNGEPVTDMDAQVTTYYRTAGTGWLDVSFDETGSWRARMTRTDLAPGVHAATVRFTRGEVVQDATISVLVR